MNDQPDIKFSVNSTYELMDRYEQMTGRVFLTGTQALARIPLMQKIRDEAHGLDTAGFVSGYRGSPLAVLDKELWSIRDHLKTKKIEFIPAVNEELAATAVLGSQQVETDPKRQVEGVFGLWYGKGPGVDRAGDALKHGNAYGSSPTGGVLVVAGDDHGSVSSSMPHQSDAAFLTFFMPILNPSSVAEYLSFGEYGYALSRFSGMWVGFKATTETVESAMSVDLLPPREFVTPDFIVPQSGLHYRWPDFPGPHIEERLEAKKHAVLAFAEANPIDRHIYHTPQATYGIVTTGKAHLDLMEALRLLGIGEEEARDIGIDIYKIGMVWPLAKTAALDFVKGKREVLVIEEKRGIIESQLKEYFYDYPGAKPDRMVGKNDELGTRLVPWIGELSPLQLAVIVAKRLDKVFEGLDLTTRVEKLRQAEPVCLTVEGATRSPYFCSGCPHNRSTKVPEGSQSLAGIGCHFMASWMDRNTNHIIQMGGEGGNWVANSLFNGGEHVFQNLGDGTYYHSGSLAIRQAIAAGTNITYKILYNDVTAMTGGQPADGPQTVDSIANSLRAEGIERIAILSNDIGKLDRSKFPQRVTFDNRSELDKIQRELRDIKGVTALIYDQPCATEKRRRIKRGTVKDVQKFAFINQAVCEGCGDCSVTSNCLSVEPVETALGRKRKINQNSCNKDFSCVDGFCPSFVTIEGGARRKPSVEGRHKLLDTYLDKLTEPVMPDLQQPHDIVVTGVGGTGVITVGQLVTMAAHLEGKGASVLDFTGFAQKFGPVISYVRLASDPSVLNQVRIDTGCADALIGCDLVVSTSAKASATYKSGQTKAAVNLAQMPTGDFTLNPDADLKAVQRYDLLEKTLGSGATQATDANLASVRLLGDSVYANILLLGFAWQQGLVPVSFTALMRAIELNGVAVEVNKTAFAWGRVLFENPQVLAETSVSSSGKKDLAIEMDQGQRIAFLTRYQNVEWAHKFRTFIDTVEHKLESCSVPTSNFVTAVEKSLFKLMTYKDEYEVARLHSDPLFMEQIAREFEGDYKIIHHLAPPLMPSGKDERGRPKKRAYGKWIRKLFPALAGMRQLRGTPLDVFGYHPERKMERQLIDWYIQLIGDIVPVLSEENLSAGIAAARLPMGIRGYGSVKETAVLKVKEQAIKYIAQLGN